MNIGMFAYYLSLFVEKKDYGNCMSIFLKIVEIIGYYAPVILGIIPINKSNEAICMAITVICVFCAIFITFANKGSIIKNEKINSDFWISWKYFITYLFISSYNYYIN